MNRTLVRFAHPRPGGFQRQHHGPIPDNIVGGELQRTHRGFDDDWDGGDGFDDSDFEDSNEGDDVPQDGDVDVDSDEDHVDDSDDDSGPVASNIVCDCDDGDDDGEDRSRLVSSSDGFRSPDGRVLSGEAMRQAGGIVPGPMSCGRLGL